jgi:hypothetical protein
MNFPPRWIFIVCDASGGKTNAPLHIRSVSGGREFMQKRTRRLIPKCPATARLITNLTVPLIIAIACYVPGTAHAGKVKADKHSAQQAASSSGKSAPFADPSMSLKIDSGMPGSRLAMAEEVCDEPEAGAANTASPERKPATVLAQGDTAKAKQSWEILPTDKTLSAALGRWAKSAGWQLVWELPVDYSVDARTTVPGTFEEAVGMVAKGMDTAEISMKAIFYAGNRVLRIVAKGTE